MIERDLNTIIDEALDLAQRELTNAYEVYNTKDYLAIAVDVLAREVQDLERQLTVHELTERKIA